MLAHETGLQQPKPGKAHQARKRLRSSLQHLSE
jgi:hypothetical protein